MTAPNRSDYYRLPHHMVYVLASGIYWRAACNCHLNQVIGLNPYADRSKAGAK